MKEIWEQSKEYRVSDRVHMTEVQILQRLRSDGIFPWIDCYDDRRGAATAGALPAAATRMQNIHVCFFMRRYTLFPFLREEDVPSKQVIDWVLLKQAPCLAIRLCSSGGQAFLLGAGCKHCQDSHHRAPPIRQLGPERVHEPLQHSAGVSLGPQSCISLCRRTMACMVTRVRE